MIALLPLVVAAELGSKILYTANTSGWITVREAGPNASRPAASDVYRMRMRNPRGIHIYSPYIAAATEDRRVIIALVGSAPDAPVGPQGLWLLVRGSPPRRILKGKYDAALGLWLSPDGSSYVLAARYGYARARVSRVQTANGISDVITRDPLLQMLTMGPS